MERKIVLTLLALAASSLGWTGPAEGAAPPVIRHQPAAVAIPGQSLSIKASVTGSSKIKAVRLFYSTSKDVAPFKVDMQPTGQDTYIGTIAPNLLKAALQVTYYMEAVDSADATMETPWYTVSIQSPQAGAGSAATNAPDEESSSWTTPLLIGGGILVVGGGAAAIIASSDKGHDDDSSPAADVAGAYVGSVDLFFQLGEQNPATETKHGTTITISPDGAVTSADLHTGTPLNGKLSGLDFALVATLAETNGTGQVTYNGKVESSGRISGSIGGTSTTGGGNGTYYGSFSAVKQ